MKERFQRLWRAFANIAIVFSFIVNLVLVLVLILAIGPLLQLKTNLLEPLLSNLDRAFLGLGETTIHTTVPVDQSIPIQFDLPLDQPLALNFELPINQDTVVVLLRDTSIPNTTVYLNNVPVRTTVVLPAGTPLPVRLNMVVPVQKTIPVQMTVPVSQTVPIKMDIPVAIQLGPSGLDPAVQRLREVFVPARTLIESLPDEIRLR
ncbi:MAG: hypothetical protein N2556_04310 [Anaerolineae bacterium]|nr:hypothetical protein [Anaerolineae bacterium]